MESRLECPGIIHQEVEVLETRLYLVRKTTNGTEVSKVDTNDLDMLVARRLNNSLSPLFCFRTMARHDSMKALASHGLRFLEAHACACSGYDG